MLPFDNKPWAKALARTVIGFTIVALASLAYYLHTQGSLRVPEITGIFLLFLTIVPPNLAVLYPKLLPKRQAPNDQRTRSAH
jgi:hypothetical protein